MPSTFSARWSAALEYLSLVTGYRVLLLVIGGLYGLAFVTGLRSRSASLPGKA